MTKDIGKPTQAEKQAFWAEQMPDFKANYICQSQLEALEFNNKTGNFDALTKDETGFELEDILESYHSVNTGWSMWLKAKAYEAEKSKGCVMVPVRTDNEIIDQTIKLMDLLATSTNRFQRDPKCIFPFESNNPRVKEWWYVACQIQELLTNTDPTNCDFDEYKADVEAARGGNENT